MSATVSVDCPAKTNLTLHVGAKQAAWAGRHALDTIYCALSVADTVTVSEAPAGSGATLRISGEHLGDLTPDSDIHANHAIRALDALAQASGHPADAAVHITKRIPVAAGLGGGSADAAATLLALNTLWGLHWPMEQLMPIAAGLGADMPFCLVGGYAHGTGFGERIDRIAADSAAGINLQRQGFAGRVLIGAYDTPLSTPEVYAEFDRIGNGKDDSCRPRSENDLQYAAIRLHPRSGIAIDVALAAGASHAFVSGSGPSVVAFVPSDQAMDGVRRAWHDGRAVDRIIEANAPAQPRIQVLPSVSDCR